MQNILHILQVHRNIRRFRPVCENRALPGLLTSTHISKLLVPLSQRAELVRGLRMSSTVILR